MPPLTVRLLPCASFAWTVIVEEPTSTLAVVGSAVIVVVDPDATPGMNVTVGLTVVMVWPLIVPVSVSVSATVSLRVAV